MGTSVFVARLGLYVFDAFTVLVVLDVVFDVVWFNFVLFGRT